MGSEMCIRDRLLQFQIEQKDRQCKVAPPAGSDSLSLRPGSSFMADVDNITLECPRSCDNGGNFIFN